MFLKFKLTYSPSLSLCNYFIFLLCVLLTLARYILNSFNASHFLHIGLATIYLRHLMPIKEMVTFFYQHDSTQRSKFGMMSYNVSQASVAVLNLRISSVINNSVIKTQEPSSLILFAARSASIASRHCFSLTASSNYFL